MTSELVGRPMEILLVEDDLIQARLTIESLRRGAIQQRTTLVRDGQEALSFLYRQGIFAQAPRPDLILLDLRLPKVDGLSILQEIRSDFDLRPIPIVIMTSSQDESDRLACEEHEVEAFVTKPVDVSKFLGLIRQLKRYWHEDVILPQV